MNRQLLLVLDEKNHLVSYSKSAEAKLGMLKKYIGKNFYDMLETENQLKWDKGSSTLFIEGNWCHIEVETFLGRKTCQTIISILLDSREQTDYRHIINSIPDAIVIVQDGEIKMANQYATRFIENLEGNSLEILLGDNSEIARNRIQDIIKRKTTGSSIDYTIFDKSGRRLVAELTPSYIEYNGQPAILSVGRDITVKKSDLQEAARMQKMLMNKRIPNLSPYIMRYVYIPSMTVSGDFYFFESMNETQVVGLLGDIRGKGVTAAMNISAFEILFREAVQKKSDITDIVDYLNKKVGHFFGDLYVAALICLFDKTTDTVTFIGAGINEFHTINTRGVLEHRIVRGPFLGMFEKPEFDQMTLHNRNIKRFLLYSDGFLESMLSKSEHLDRLTKENIFEVEKEIQKVLEAKVVSLDGLHDDSTLLIFESNVSNQHNVFHFSGMTDYSHMIDSIIDEMGLPDMAYCIKLIIVELLTNAYKYGNQRDPELPIILGYTFYKNSLMIEVTDVGIVKKKLIYKRSIEDEDLMNESGRGLFLIEQLADEITIIGNTVVVELKLGR